MTGKMVAAVASAMAVLLLVATPAQADDSKNGPSVYNDGDVLRAGAKFYADSSDNGTGDTLRLTDYASDGHSAVLQYQYPTQGSVLWNTGGVNTDKYLVLGGGIGLPEGTEVYYSVCWGDADDPYDLHDCSDWVSGIA
jgi:hypothetical protein